MSAFIGAKTESGYSWRRPVTENAMQYLKYAAATATVHKTGTNSLPESEWAQVFNYSIVAHQALNIEGIENRTNCLFDPSTALKVVIMLRENTYLIGFGQMGSFITEESSLGGRVISWMNQLGQVGANFLGSVPRSYILAANVVRQVKDKFPGKAIEIVGHSLGGSLAQYAALKTDTKATIINSAPIGAGLQSDIGITKLRDSHKWIRHLSIDGDWLSNKEVVGQIDRFISALGITTPGSFGFRETIPCIFKNSREAHSCVVGSVAAQSGLGNPNNPAMLKNGLSKRLS